MRRDARRPHRRERRAGLREQMPDDERRVAHHVVEHAAALQLAAPEPRHVRPAVLLGRAREIRTSRRRRAARPEQLAPRFDLRREDLVLEIAVRESRRASRARATRFASATFRASGFSQAMPASVPFPLSIACDDLLDVLDARVIRPGEPDRVDRRIGDHVGDRRVRLSRRRRRASRASSRGRRGVLLVRAPDAEDVGVAHARETPACGSAR